MKELVSDMEKALNEVAYLVLEAKHLVAFVGAGMSVESGIPPFRGPGGLWTRYGEPTSLDYDGFLEDPGAWWERGLQEESEDGNPTYELKVAVDGAVPNAGHYALRALERAGLLKCVITQNVDNLHRRAGSENVLEIHGNRTLLRCLDCQIRIHKAEFQFNHLPPRCGECGGIVKIDSVMFGEGIPPDVMSACIEQANSCDCMLLIGTSGTVYPAAQLPLAAKDRGSSMIEINLYETHLTSMADIVLRGLSGEILPRIVERVGDSRCR